MAVRPRIIVSRVCAHSVRQRGSLMCVRSHISGTSVRAARSTGCWPTTQSVASVQSLRTVQSDRAAAATALHHRLHSPSVAPAAPTALNDRTVLAISSTNRFGAIETPRRQRTAGSVSLIFTLLLACAATLVSGSVGVVHADNRLADYRGDLDDRIICRSSGGCRAIGSNQLDSVITFFVLNMAYSWENRVDFVVKYMYGKCPTMQ